MPGASRVPFGARLTFVLLTLVAACSGRPLELRFGGDAAAELEPMVMPPPVMAANRCERGNACPTGMRCLPNCASLSVACQRSSNGFGGQDAVCVRHEDCQAGFACARPLADSITTRCMRLCRGHGDCARDDQCLETRLNCDSSDVGQTLLLLMCQNPPARRPSVDGGR